MHTRDSLPLCSRKYLVYYTLSLEQGMHQQAQCGCTCMMQHYKQESLNLPEITWPASVRDFNHIGMGFDDILTL